jgi:hypothetical protein
MRNMKKNKLVIQIQRPVSEVFDFLLDPRNTPSWVESFVIEKTNEWPVKVGTIYRNQDFEGHWGEYTLISLEQNKFFEMLASDHNYHVRYTFTEPEPGTTGVEYFEWVEQGEIEGPFVQKILEKLKEVLENR